jgi:hypothetical protein
MIRADVSQKLSFACIRHDQRIRDQFDSLRIVVSARIEAGDWIEARLAVLQQGVADFAQRIENPYRLPERMCAYRHVFETVVTDCPGPWRKWSRRLLRFTVDFDSLAPCGTRKISDSNSVSNIPRPSVPPTSGLMRFSGSGPSPGSQGCCYECPSQDGQTVA